MSVKINDVAAYKSALTDKSFMDAIKRQAKTMNYAELKFQGFDIQNMVKIILEKANKADPDNVPLQIVQLCAVGYMRGNVHELGITKTSTEGQMTIKRLMTNFNIRARASGKEKGQGAKTNDVTFARATVCFPEVVCAMLHGVSGGEKMPARMVVERGVSGVNDLPNVMKFANFLPLAVGLAHHGGQHRLGYKNNDHLYTVSRAWMAWDECLLHEIIRKEDQKDKPIDLSYLLNQAELVKHNPFIDHDMSLELLQEWSVIDAQGRLHANVIRVAKGFEKKYGLPELVLS